MDFKIGRAGVQRGASAYAKRKGKTAPTLCHRRGETSACQSGGYALRLRIFGCQKSTSRNHDAMGQRELGASRVLGRRFDKVRRSQYAEPAADWAVAESGRMGAIGSAGSAIGYYF